MGSAQVTDTVPPEQQAPPRYGGYTAVPTADQAEIPPAYNEAVSDAEAQAFDNLLLKECSLVVRLNFIRKVYAILAAQFALTSLVATVMMYSAPVRSFVQSNSWLLFLSSFLALGLVIPLICYRKKEPLNKYLLAAFTLSESYTIGLVCSIYESEKVLQAAILTFGVFIGLTLYTLQSKRKFEGYAPFLFVSLTVLIQAAFLQIFFPFSNAVDLICAVFGAVVFCAFIVYDTYQIFEKLTPDEYILGSLQLYLDVLNLFLQILKLLGKRNVEGKEKRMSIREPFQPDVLFDAGNAVKVTNTTSKSVAINGKVVAGGQTMQLPTRGDWQSVVVAQAADGSPLFAKYLAPGSHWRWSGAAEPALPAGISVALSQKPESQHQNILLVENATATSIRVAISHITGGIANDASVSWTTIGPHSDLVLPSSGAVVVQIGYFDGARAGLLITPESKARVIKIAAHFIPPPPFVAPPLSDSSRFSIMTFNIRYGDANDKLNSWSYRRFPHFSVYAQHEPTIFGLQEAFLFQRREISAAFPWYQTVGTGRNSDLSGEATPIYYDARRFMLRFADTFWLSELPHVPGSRTPSWGNTLPRIATIAHLIPIPPATATSGDSFVKTPEVIVANVHLDNAAPVAREKGIKLVCARLREYKQSHNIGPEVLTVLMGDFNCVVESAPENKVVENDSVLGFYDPVKKNHAGEGSFHDFTGVCTLPRIDFVYISRTFASKVIRTEILNDHVGDSESGYWWPSDHLPVLISLE
ncbi:Transmembrane BAX inhibitor motif-containing protein 4 [Physocladia obscura]|uniref:Transmembrane BAX inhibitor motif-containing protein 4 n=1 Tax=Physocladia obscura TaxID=109957 RepID=A0AAD5X988_9FUNG|nr:Transmembrane BAX inhibitor motif-containing protein 4 [Physocladia obscura]